MVEKENNPYKTGERFREVLEQSTLAPVYYQKFLTEHQDRQGNNYKSFVIAENEENALKILEKRAFEEKIVGVEHISGCLFFMPRPIEEQKLLEKHGFKIIRIYYRKTYANGEIFIEWITQFEGGYDDLYTAYEIFEKNNLPVFEARRSIIKEKGILKSVNEITTYRGCEFPSEKIESQETDNTSDEKVQNILRDMAKQQSIMGLGDYTKENPKEGSTYKLVSRPNNEKAICDILTIEGFDKEQQNKALKIGLLKMQIQDIRNKGEKERQNRDTEIKTRVKLIEELLS